jgi:hypothetical protein
MLRLAQLQRPCLQAVFCGLGVLGLPACTTVNIYAGDGSVAVHRSFGFVNLQATPGSTPIVFRGTSLGLQSGPWGHSLGYTQTSLALLPAGCHVVVMPANEQQAASPTVQALRHADPCASAAPPATPTPGGD